jgi:hypothetical protein
MAGEVPGGTAEKGALYATLGLRGPGACGKADRHNREYRNLFHWNPHICGERTHGLPSGSRIIMYD